jgi:hypothetical protein
MTRQHFQALADALRAAKPAPEDYQTPGYATTGGTFNAIAYDAAMGAWYSAVGAVADVARTFNGRFDRGRFYLAVGR